MKKLLEGYARFRRDIFPAQRHLFESLAAGQYPETLFITCSDSRVVPSLITQTVPGTLFEIQNAGNLVPPYGTGLVGGTVATLEFAVAVLKVRHIVVCGHSDCGAIKALLDPTTLTSVPQVAAWLAQAGGTRTHIERELGHATPEVRLRAAIGLNARAQLDNARTHPLVAAAVARGELELHAWYYDFVRGVLWAWNSATEAFERLPEDSDPAP